MVNRLRFPRPKSKGCGRMVVVSRRSMQADFGDYGRKRFTWRRV